MNDEKLALPDGELALKAIESLAIGVLRAMGAVPASAHYQAAKEKVEWAMASLAHAITEHHKRAFKKAVLKTLESFGKTDELMDRGLSALPPSELAKMFVGTITSMMEKVYKEFPEREYLVVPRYPNMATTIGLASMLTFNGAGDKGRIAYDLYRMVTAIGSITSHSAAPANPMMDSEKKTFSIKAEDGTQDWPMPLKRVGA